MTQVKAITVTEEPLNNAYIYMMGMYTVVCTLMYTIIRDDLLWVCLRRVIEELIELYPV